MRNKRIRKRIRDNLFDLSEKRMVLATVARSIPHIAQLPLYAIKDTFGIFGFYNTRLSEKVAAALQGRYRELGLPQLRVAEHEPWFKPMEYFVINRVPEATVRMYDYLVISGLFRSVSLIFLISSAAISFHFIMYLIYGEWKIEPFSLRLNTSFTCMSI